MRVTVFAGDLCDVHAEALCTSTNPRLSLAMGTGVTKPNISTLMGLTYDERRPGDAKLRGDAFYMFYFAINLGSVVSMTVLPFVAKKDGLFAGSQGFTVRLWFRNGDSHG